MINVKYGVTPLRHEMQCQMVTETIHVPWYWRVWYEIEMPLKFALMVTSAQALFVGGFKFWAWVFS